MGSVDSDTARSWAMVAVGERRVTRGDRRGAAGRQGLKYLLVALALGRVLERELFFLFLSFLTFIYF